MKMKVIKNNKGEKITLDGEYSVRFLGYECSGIANAMLQTDDDILRGTGITVSFDKESYDNLRVSIRSFEEVELEQFLYCIDNRWPVYKAKVRK